MSRSISIGYRLNDEVTWLPQEGSTDLLGTQHSSMTFWSIPLLQQLGLTELVELGYTGPVWFRNWKTLSVLNKEISILEENISIIEFDEELKTRWIENLRINFNALIAQCPEGAEPEYMIG